ALTIRALIGEKTIFLREQAVGLSTTAYLLAKIAVFTAFAIIQSLIVTTITVVGKGWGDGAVDHGAFLSGRTLELFVDISATCVAAAMTGLALSALAKSAEQIMPLLVVAIMSQLVFSGGLIPVTGRVVLDQLSWVTPARWGFASSASTVDLTRLAPPPLLPDDEHWKHTSSAWLFDIGMLVLLSVFYTGFVRWRIRLPRG
ncbi:MAG: ABC transporter permease, partial [Mycobacterium sp.]